MTVKTITARQCKQARDLLKWNLHDLSSRTNIPPKHLERFERSLSRLSLPENMEVKKLFERQGVIFTDNLEVRLRNKEDATDDMSQFNRMEKIEVDHEGRNIDNNQEDEGSVGLVGSLLNPLKGRAPQGNKKTAAPNPLDKQNK